MKIFGTNTKYAGDGHYHLSSVNCQLSVDEVNLIKESLSLLKKTSNDVIESIKSNLVQSLNTL